MNGVAQDPEQDRSSIDPPREGSTYRPIGEVAALLRLQPHVLRFWETKFKQIAPLKRSGGRRYYRREDVRLLFQIRDLLYVEGYTLRGAQKVLRERTRATRVDEADACRDTQRHDEAQKAPPLSDAVRADLLRISKRLEETLALCSELGQKGDEERGGLREQASEQEARQEEAKAEKAEE